MNSRPTIGQSEKDIGWRIRYNVEMDDEADTFIFIFVQELLFPEVSQKNCGRKTANRTRNSYEATIQMKGKFDLHGRLSRLELEKNTCSSHRRKSVYNALEKKI